MLNNGYTSEGGGKSKYSCFFIWICLFIYPVVMWGCRRTLHVAQETREDIHTGVRETTTADTVTATGIAREEKRDSAEVNSVEISTIIFDRDSAGRLIGIKAVRRADYKGNFSRNTKSGYRADRFDASRSSETSATVDSFSEKKEEIAQTSDSFSPVSFIIKWIAVWILAILVIYLSRLQIWRK